MAKIKSHWKQLVFELSEYIFDALTFACPVLAKLCSIASSVESSIFIWWITKQRKQAKNSEAMKTNIWQNLHRFFSYLPLLAVTREGLKKKG